MALYELWIDELKKLTNKNHASAQRHRTGQCVCVCAVYASVCVNSGHKNLIMSDATTFPLWEKTRTRKSEVETETEDDGEKTECECKQTALIYINYAQLTSLLSRSLRFTWHLLRIRLRPQTERYCCCCCWLWWRLRCRCLLAIYGIYATSDGRTAEAMWAIWNDIVDVLDYCVRMFECMNVFELHED